MIKKIMQLIFMDKSGRAAAKRLRKSHAQIAAAEALSAESEAAEEAEAPDGAPASDRDILLGQAMDLYRQRRAEYEQLDEGVRAKLSKLADDKMGNKESQSE